MDKKKGWFYVAISCVAASILSMFISILTYTPVGKGKMVFSILDLIGDSTRFTDYVVYQYDGPILFEINATFAAVLVVIALAAIICAVVGLITLRAQRPNTWQFVLTIIGLVGVAGPSIVLFVTVLGFGKYYQGTIGLGIAPFVGIIAMIVSIAAVVRRKNKVAEQLRRELESRGMIWKAGNL